MRKQTILTVFVAAFASFSFAHAQENGWVDPYSAIKEITVPTIDISGELQRQQVIAQATEETMQNSPSSLLMPDNKTIFLAWALNEESLCGQLKKSTDAGLTWSGMLPVPENWKRYRNCPPLYLLKDPQGKERILTYANRTPYGYKMGVAYSEDNGDSWTPFAPVMVAGTKDTLKADVMPFTAIIPIQNGKRLLGLTNMRSPYFKNNLKKKTNIVVQSYSDDGGISWTQWRTILDLGEENLPCEPEVIVSPDGKELLMLIRDNNRNNNSWMMTSRNEGLTWENLRQVPASLTLDRHTARYLPDGRLIIAGRDVAKRSPSKRHFVAWVGTYDDIINGREGQYRIKMLHSFDSTMYPGLSVLPDGTVVAISSVVYCKGEKHSVVQTRFNIREIDKMYKKGKNILPPKE